MSQHPGVFMVKCCGKRRGMLPGGVLVCYRCDYDHRKATVIPNEGRITDVPRDVDALCTWRER